MATLVDTSYFVTPNNIAGEDAEDARLLRVLLEEASNYITSFRWCPLVAELLLAFGVGGVLALFLVRFEQPITGFEDQELWVVVGDLPFAYFVTDDAETPAKALQAYCELMEDWADEVLSGGEMSQRYPVAAAPTKEHAQMLKTRIEFIRKRLVPKARSQTAAATRARVARRVNPDR